MAKENDQILSTVTKNTLTIQNFLIKCSKREIVPEQDKRYQVRRNWWSDTEHGCEDISSPLLNLCVLWGWGNSLKEYFVCFEPVYLS